MFYTSTSKRTYSSYGAAKYEPPTMDRVTVPSGSWQKAYEKKQASYNVQLLACTAFLLITLIACNQAGIFYLNWYPPTRKEDKK
ncbi:hypothetical protein M0802_009945 [Mischocyttarus mexicanus]|nr:hypothetical protein M0802_009945 [Mischocyttarus mexicanus]